MKICMYLCLNYILYALKVFAGLNFHGLWIYTIFVDYTFTDEGVFIFSIVYIDHRFIQIQ